MTKSEEQIKEIVSKCKASQSSGELTFLLNTLVTKPRKVVLEIGVHQGYSLDIWAKALEPALMMGIDTDFSSYDENIYKGNTELKLIQGKSQDGAVYDQIVNYLVDRDIDFLFIDGDHHYQSVKDDFEIYLPLVKKGGVIALHDAGLKDNPDVEVYKFWDEIASKYGGTLIRDVKEAEYGVSPLGTGTGIIVI